MPVTAVDFPPWYRGPRLASPKPSSAGDSTPPAEELEPVELEPTRWAESPRRLIINPNVCEICNGRPHPDTPHHRFEPAVEPEAHAQRLGWPMPTNQEPLP